MLKRQYVGVFELADRDTTCKRTMSTNMLTWSELETHVAARKLRKWEPSKAGTAPDGRCLYMTPDVFEAILVKPWPATRAVSLCRARDRRAAMRMVLERYVKGFGLNLDRDMKELGSMKQNAAMRGFWEFRSGQPIEETRLFGFFARPGAFVAFSFEPRGKFGGASDPAWKAERDVCETGWKTLFGARPYLTSPWPVRDRPAFLTYVDRTDD